MNNLLNRTISGLLQYTDVADDIRKMHQRNKQQARAISELQTENKKLSRALQAIAEHNQQFHPKNYWTFPSWILSQIGLGKIQHRNVKDIKGAYHKIRTAEKQTDCIKAAKQGISPMAARLQRANRADMTLGELNSRTY